MINIGDHRCGCPQSGTNTPHTPFQLTEMLGDISLTPPTIDRRKQKCLLFDPENNKNGRLHHRKDSMTTKLRIRSSPSLDDKETSPAARTCALSDRRTQASALITTALDL